MEMQGRCMVAAKPLPATPRPAIPAPAEGSLVRAARCELAQWVATRCVSGGGGAGDLKAGRSVNLDIATVTPLCALCSCSVHEGSRVKSQECCPSLPRRPSCRCSTLARGVTDSEGCGSESLVGRQRLRRLAQSRPSNFTPLQDGGREGSLSTTTKRASTLIFTAVLPHRCVRFW
jgi:hypothetical protein